MDDITLKKLNGVADKLIENEKLSALDSELFFYMAEKIKSLDLINETNKGIQVLLSREETLKNVLNFYKAIDDEYYNIALDFLLQLKKNKYLKIFPRDKKNLSKLEKYVLKLGGYNLYEHIRDETSIYISTKEQETKKEKDIGNKNTDTINNSRIIVHEIAHCFDRKKTEDIFSMAAIIKEKNMVNAKEFQKVKDKVDENNYVRDVFSETTAVTFEKLYLQYLMEKTYYPKSNIKSLVVKRINNSLFSADTCYDSLRIAKLKNEKGLISDDDIEILAKEYDEDRKKIERRIKRVINGNGSIKEPKRYALASLFAPTVVEKYNEKGKIVLKKYIQAVNNNSIDEIFDLLQVEKSKKGVDVLFENLKKDLKKYFPSYDKEINANKKIILKEDEER